MAGEDSHQDDRTEDATPRRLERAREEGNVPVSREVVALASLALVTAVLHLGGGTVLDLGHRMTAMLTRLETSRDVGVEVLYQVGLAVLWGAGPFMAAALLGGAAAVLLQTGFHVTPSGVKVDWRRLAPGAGFRRLFGAEGLVEAAKSLVKLGAIGLAIWHALDGYLPQLAGMAERDPHTILRHAVRPLEQVLLTVLAVQVAIAGADLFWVRFQHARRLRMSRQDIREETREAEGDPRIKARIRQIRQQRARRRMLAAVPKATVVVTNPTHFAVALAYDRMRSAAPRVVAKGVDSMAARIREVAQAHGVPLVANPPLARALIRVELESEIPAEYFQLVAEIIAYVWRLNQRSRGRLAE